MIPLSTNGPMCAEAEVFNALTENKSFQGLPDHLIQVQTTESTHSTMGMLSAAEASRSTRRRRRCRAWSHRAQGTVQTCSSSAQRHDMHTAACSMQRRQADDGLHQADVHAQQRQWPPMGDSSRSGLALDLRVAHLRCTGRAR